MINTVLKSKSLGLIILFSVIAHSLQAQQTVALTIYLTDSVETPRTHYLAIGRLQESYLPPDTSLSEDAQLLATPATDLAALQKAKVLLTKKCQQEGWPLFFPYDQIPFDYLGFPSKNNLYRSNEFRIILKDSQQIKQFMQFTDQLDEMYQGNIEPVYPEAEFAALSMDEITRRAEQEARRLLKDRGITVTSVTAIKHPNGVGWTAYPPTLAVGNRANDNPVNPHERNGLLRQYRTMEVSVVLRIP